MRLLLIVTLFVLAVGIAGLSAYYTGFMEQPVVPGWVFVLALVYIALQVIKTQVIPASSKKTDWIYYFGLIMMAIPAFMNEPSDILAYRWLFVFGVANMIIPPLLDLLNWKKEQTL